MTTVRLLGEARAEAVVVIRDRDMDKVRAGLLVKGTVGTRVDRPVDPNGNLTFKVIPNRIDWSLNLRNICPLDILKHYLL